MGHARYFRLFFMTAWLIAASAEAGGLSPSEAMKRVSPRAIRAHMTFLSDDLLEGRGTGTRGYDLAAAYVASQFSALGLEPAGDSAGYFQVVPFRRADLITSAAEGMLIGPEGRRKLVYEEDFIYSKDPVHPETELEAPIVYVGHGVTAPEFGHDDYAGIDVRGKIIVFVRGAPARFSHDELAYYADQDVKLRNAVERGAVGAFAIRTVDAAARQPWSRAVQNHHVPGMYWVAPDGRIAGSFPEIQVNGTLSEAGAAKVFAQSPHTLEEALRATQESRVLSFDLGVSGRFERKTRHAPARSANVAGLLPGSDPKLKQEIVVVTAHLDHLGIGVPADGDSIYNGAYDNASGVAIMLELARALTAMSPSPRRSILFLAVTGEEKGLLGSEYYAEYPTLPIENVVANVNLDMFLMLHAFVDVVAFGAEHSSLEAAIHRAAEKLRVRVTPDPVPEETIFIRSDQYSFVKKGIPSVFLVGGYGGGEEADLGRSVDETWDRDVYHSQRDDMNQVFDFEAGAKFARLNYLLCLDLANAKERPRWKPGDFFGERFAGARSAP